MRDKIGGHPYDTKKEDGKLIVKFYRSGENLKNPDHPVLTLKLGKDDLRKLSKLS